MRLRIHTLIMLMLCAVMTAWGETVTYTMTIDSKSEGGNNNVHWLSSNTNQLTWNDITWNVGFTKKDNSTGVSVNVNYAHIGSTDHPATKITISTTGFAGKSITKVALSGYCMSNTGPTLSIQAGETTILNSEALTKKTSGTSGENIPTYASTNTENIVLNENDAITFTINNPSAKCGIAIYAVSVEYEEPVPASVTLNSSGFATYASIHPLDFFNASGYTAWQITGVSGNVINFQQITGPVAAGSGVFLKGTAGESMEIPFATTGEDIRGTNKLVGITTATEIASGEYYGLSGSNFVKVNAGKVPAGKALLPAEVVGEETQGEDVKALMFVFDHIDGVRSIETVSAEAAAEVFNLAGQRINNRQPGINIINGKKVLVK